MRFRHFYMQKRDIFQANFVNLQPNDRKETNCIYNKSPLWH